MTTAGRLHFTRAQLATLGGRRASWPVVSLGLLSSDSSDLSAGGFRIETPIMVLPTVSFPICVLLGQLPGA